MYFFNLNALTKDLKERPLTDREAFPYVVAWIAVSLFPLSGEDPETQLNNLLNIVAYLIEIAGFVWLYRINGGRHGIGFLGRFFSISWVVDLWTIVVGVPFLIIVVIAIAITGLMMGLQMTESLFEKIAA